MKHALAVALLLACSRFPLDFAVDRTFPSDDVDALHVAASKWNAVTVFEAKISFDGEEWWIANKPPKGGFNGITYSGEHVIEIAPRPRADGTPTLPIALHEFGHALGLPHSCTSSTAKGAAVTDAPPCVAGEPRGVMDPGNVSLVDLQPIDLELCRREGACK